MAPIRFFSGFLSNSLTPLPKPLTKNPTFSSPIFRFSTVDDHFLSRPHQNMNPFHDDDENNQNPPNPIPNRPLRGPKQTHTQTEKHPLRKPISHKAQFQVPATEFSESSFLDKFKMATSGIPDEKKKIKMDEPEIKEAENTVPEDSKEIFKKMKETGLIPNAVQMLDGLCKDGLVQDAMKLFGLMREKGTFPEVVVYTAVVDGFCKAQKLDDAIRIFRKMQSNGVSPNAFSYTVLINGLCKCRRLSDGLDICLEMIEAGHTPNVSTFVGLVNVYCKEKDADVEGVKTVIKRLVEKGYFLDERAVKEFLENKGPFLPLVWEAIFGKKTSRKFKFS